MTRHIGKKPSLGTRKDVAHMPMSLNGSPKLPLGLDPILRHRLLEFIQHDCDGSLLGLGHGVAAHT